VVAVALRRRFVRACERRPRAERFSFDRGLAVAVLHTVPLQWRTVAVARLVAETLRAALLAQG
jgi:hypothetical protein